LSYTPQPSYKNIAAILKSGQDKAGAKTQTPRPACEHDAHSFIRGAGYYGGGNDVE
jgi:hypothetical protein